MSWFSTSRLTGLFYLGMAVAGAIGYLMAGSQIYVDGDATATLNNVLDAPALARTSLLGDLGVVLFQVLTALWFFRLFKRVNSFAAGALVAFGIMNAVAVLVGLIGSATAVQVAHSAGDASNVQLLWDMRENAWGVGNLFFGLWLIPMGYLALQSNMPRVLGWILYAGGISYILSAVVRMASPNLTTLLEALAIPTIIGEFWIIGYLLIKPVNPGSPAAG